MEGHTQAKISIAGHHMRGTWNKTGDTWTEDRIFINKLMNEPDKFAIWKVGESASLWSLNLSGGRQSSRQNANFPQKRRLRLRGQLHKRDFYFSLITITTMIFSHVYALYREHQALCSIHVRLITRADGFRTWNSCCAPKRRSMIRLFKSESDYLHEQLFIIGRRSPAGRVPDNFHVFLGICLSDCSVIFGYRS